MTAITSGANGSWQNSGTWVGGVIPGIGDTVTIAHNVTIDADTTFGTSPAAGGNVLTVNTTKVLTLNASMFIRGGFTLAGSGKINIAVAGAGIEFDPSNAASPSTAAYLGIIGTGHNSTPAVQATGVLGNQCFIRTKFGAATTAHAQLTDGTGPWLQAGLIQAVQTLFQRLGDASRPAILVSPTGVSVFTLELCVFDACGAINQTFNVGVDATYELKNNLFTNSLDDHNIQIATGGAVAAGSRKVWDNAFDKRINFFPGESFDIQRNYFALGLATTDGDWALLKGNFVRMTTANPGFNAGGHTDGNYYFFDEPGEQNPHFVEVLKYGRSQTHQNSVFDMSCNNVGQEGDGYMFTLPSAACVATIKNNLIVRGPSDRTVATLLSALGNANTSAIIEHNTVMTGNQGTAVGETYAGHAGMLQSFKSNLFVSKLGGEGLKLYDSGVDDSVSNLVTAANADFNSGFGLLAGSNLKGYNNLEFSAGSPGANDIDVDPSFVDDTRRLVTWSTNQGGPGTVADALTRILGNRGLIDTLIQWVKAGFRPTNVLLENAGHDGVTIGALAFEASASMTASPGTIVANSTGNIITITGVGTAWTPGTPGAPAFGVSGVIGANITAQTINNATSATLTITASTGGNIGNLVIDDGTISAPPIVVSPAGTVPVPRKDEWWAMMSEWAGYLNTWFLNNNHPANDQGLAQTYYDGQMCGYRLKDHFGNNNYDSFIQEGWLAYTDYYVLPNNGTVQGFRNFTEGELQDVLRVTANAADSLQAINEQLVNGAFVASGDVSDSTLSRECAYALETHINAARAGVVLSAPQIARRDQLKAWAMGHIDQWVVNMTAPYFRPFMGGITAKALIDYYDYVTADVNIIVKLRAMADYTWTTCWKSASGPWGAGKSFTYTDRVGPFPGDDPSMDGFTQPDLNLMIGPLWGWLYYKLQGAIYRVNGDQIFDGAVPVYTGAVHVSGSYLGTRSALNPAGKQYDQQLYWGPRYIEWAENVQPTSISVSPDVLTADTPGNIVTVTGVGTSWTPGTPGVPVFSVSGVTGGVVTNQVVNSATSATLTLTSSTGGNTGVLLVSDGATTDEITVQPIPPVGGGGIVARRRPY